MTFVYDKWNPWTSRSSDVSFNFKKQGEGNGERKLAAEFCAIPKGQNFSYDLEIDGEEFEIKELDLAASHRVGVEIATGYSEIKRHILRIIEGYTNLQLKEARDFYQQRIEMLTKPHGRNRTGILEGLQKNELSESNLSKTAIFINELIDFDDSMKYKNNILYSSVDGNIYEYDHRTAFRKINVEHIPFEDKLQFIGTKEEYFWLLSTDNSAESLDFFRTKDLQDRLDSLVREPFSTTRLVIVDQNRGYYPIKNLSIITCNRITQGNPRIQILL